MRFLLLLLTCSTALSAYDYTPAFEYNDPNPQAYRLTERASVIDPRCKSYPDIRFNLDGKKGPRDKQWAVVNTSVPPRGRLLIWMSGSGGFLKDYASDWGMHAIGVTYARGWFKHIKQGDQPKNHWRGDIRLEATTGMDVSPLVDIAEPDGMKTRAYMFVKWLAKEHPEGNWDYFLNANQSDLDWEKVTVSGLSHGSTSAARFAIHQKVDRAVMFTGPRDQLENWQGGESATPANRFFGFAHEKDNGWKHNHYPRSWKLLGIDKFGPVVNVDSEEAIPPFQNTRQLLATVDGEQMQVHNGVYPGYLSFKDGETFIHEDVWKYLFLHPVDEVGESVTPTE